LGQVSFLSCFVFKDVLGNAFILRMFFLWRIGPSTFELTLLISMTCNFADLLFSPLSPLFLIHSGIQRPFDGVGLYSPVGNLFLGSKCFGNLGENRNFPSWFLYLGGCFFPFVSRRTASSLQSDNDLSVTQCQELFRAYLPRTLARATAKDRSPGRQKG